jgi:hypothetical protein
MWLLVEVEGVWIEDGYVSGKSVKVSATLGHGNNRGTPNAPSFPVPLYVRTLPRVCSSRVPGRPYLTPVLWHSPFGSDSDVLWADHAATSYGILVFIYSKHFLIVQNQDAWSDIQDQLSQLPQTWKKWMVIVAVSRQLTLACWYILQCYLILCHHLIALQMPDLAL